MKKAGKYTIITLLLLLGLFCVGILYLFFIPNSSLFFIAYINDNTLTKSQQYEANAVSKIKINSNFYDVNVLQSKNEYITLEVSSHSFGFVLTKNEYLYLDESLSNNILSFDIKEPHGLTANNDSYINLYLPDSQAVDLELRNEKAKTTINSKNLVINNLTYSTNSGALNIKNAVIAGDMKLNLNKSTCSIESLVKTNSNNVELKLTSGKFIANSSKLGDVTIVKNNRGVISINECNFLSEDMSESGGQINIEKISHINTITSDTIITLGEVTNGAIITSTGSGKVSISSLNGTSSIATKTGRIKINKCLTSATLNSTQGNIIVKEAYKTISAKTNSGAISVTFSEDAEHYSSTEEIKSRTLYATIHNGSLTASGVEHFGSTDVDADQGIIVTGKGKININMNDVCGINSVSGKSGNVKVIVNHKSQYKLTTNPTTTTKGSVRVNLLQIIEYHGYTDKDKKETFVNCSSSTYKNSLTISTTSGDLLVLDTMLTNY